MIHTDGTPTICNPVVDRVLNQQGSVHVENVLEDDGFREQLQYSGVIPPYDVPPCDEDPEEHDEIENMSPADLRRYDEDRADRNEEIANRLSDEDVALIFAGDFDIVPRRPASPKADSFGNEVHTYNGHGDGFTITADITVGVSGRAGGFTVDHLNEAIRRNIGGDIGPSFTIVQVRNADTDEVVYEL